MSADLTKAVQDGAIALALLETFIVIPALVKYIHDILCEKSAVEKAATIAAQAAQETCKKCLKSVLAQVKDLAKLQVTVTEQNTTAMQALKHDLGLQERLERLARDNPNRESRKKGSVRETR